MICVNCGNNNCETKNASHPIINHCNNCNYDWNPDNERAPFAVLVTPRFGTNVVGGTGYISRGGSGLTSCLEYASKYNTIKETEHAIKHIEELIRIEDDGWEDTNNIVTKLVKA